MGKQSLKTRPTDHSHLPPLTGADLAAVINRTYDVFSRHKLAGELDVCTRCCVSMEEVDALSNTALRDVSVELLTQFNDTAQSKRPSFDQLNYFLPRYFELLASRQCPSHSLELALHRLTPFSPTRWTPQERACIDDFALAMFRAHLKAPPARLYMWDTTSLLLMFWKANVDVRPLLACWEDASTPTALVDFADLAVRDIDWTSEPPRFTSPFAEDSMSESIVAWIRSEGVRSKLGSAIERALLEESAVEWEQEDLLNWAYEVIRPV